MDVQVRLRVFFTTDLWNDSGSPIFEIDTKVEETELLGNAIERALRELPGGTEAIISKELYPGFEWSFFIDQLNDLGDVVDQGTCIFSAPDLTAGDFVTLFGEFACTTPPTFKFMLNPGIGGGTLFPVLVLTRAVFEIAGDVGMLIGLKKFIFRVRHSKVRKLAGEWAIQLVPPAELVRILRTEGSQDLQKLAKRLNLNIVDCANLLRQAGFKNVDGSSLLWLPQS